MSANGLKKPRQARVPRQANPLMGMEDTGHLWAVSYADFLMVLLSFFVIFFSVNKNNKSQLILNIMSKIEKNHPSTHLTTPAPKKNASFYKHLQETPSETIQCSLGGETESKWSISNIANPVINETNFKEELSKIYHDDIGKVKIENEKLIINLPDNSYDLGSFELNEDAQTEVKLILKKLEPFMDKVRVGFVGHSDSVAVRQWAGREVSNNFDVSVMRASKVLSSAIANGFKSDHLYAVGAGSNLRNTRSLTLVISLYSGDYL